MRQTGTRKAREKKYFMSVEGGKKRGEKEMGKASGGQKEEKMKMRKNEHSPKKKKEKRWIKSKGEENGSKKKTRKATVSRAALLTLTVWKHLCECYHEILQH